MVLTTLTLATQPPNVRPPQYQQLKGRVHTELLNRLRLDKLANITREDAEPELRSLIVGILEREQETTPLSFSEREALIAALDAGTLTRPVALRRIVENQSFVRSKFNEAFVMMQYFGYLRRDPDESGYEFWLRKLNEFNGNFEQAEMVRAFLISGEYRQRFR